MTFIQILFFAIIAVLIFLVLRLMFKPLKIVMHAFKIFMSISLIILIAIAVFGYFIVKDANDFRKEFSNSTSLFALEDNSKLYTAVGINVNLETIKSNKDIYTVVNDSKLSEMQNYYAKNDIKTVGKGYYKVFLINLSLLDSLENQSIEDRTLNLTMKELKSVLVSATPKSTYADIVAKRRGLSRDQLLLGIGVDDTTFRGMIFSYVVTYVFNPSNMNVLLSGLRDGHIKVYEDTIMFKALRMIPQFIAKDTLKVSAMIKGNSTIGGG